MRPFLRDILLFGLIQMAILIGLQIRLARQSQSYLATSLDKERRLATAAGPRIVFVGGSNWAFGLDSAMVEERLGLHPVNMGLFAPLGGPFMLEEAWAGLRTGDVVVIGFEYEHYVVPKMYDGSACKSWRELLLLNPGAAAYVPPALRFELARQENGLTCVSDLVKHAIRRQRREPESAYDRDACNEYGDVSLPRQQSAMYKSPSLKRPQLRVVAEHLHRVVADLNEFQARCEGHGIRVFLALPCMPESRHAVEVAGAQAIENQLRTRCPIPVLTSVRDGCLPETLFYDTVYHLTTEGARRRTELLCDRLEAALGPPGH